MGFVLGKLFFFGYELNSDELIPLGLEAPCWPHIGHLDTGCLVIVGPMLIISGPKVITSGPKLVIIGPICHQDGQGHQTCPAIVDIC